MAEVTWTTTLAWIGVIAGAQGVAALVRWLVSAWQTRRVQAEIDVVTRATRADIAQSFRKSQQAMVESQQALDQAVTGLRQILERLGPREERRS
jgi:DNA anti-recombination protein RmuC